MVAGSGSTLVVLSAVGQRGGRLDVWLPLALRVAAALFIAAVAVRGTDRLLSGGSPLRALAPAFGVAVAAAAVLGALAPHLPLALDPGITPAQSPHPVLLGHPVLVMAQVLTVACFLVAAFLFTAQAARSNDQLVQWLGPACALAAFARVNYVLFPSLYSQWLYTGDILRTSFYLVLLVGAAREIGAYWGAQAHVAVVEDRRRLARELHDGVVQELGYIRSESSSLQTVDAPRTAHILGACDRALDEARQAVEAMGSSGDAEPLGFTVHRAARQVSDRYDVALELNLDDTVTAGQAQRHTLLRIVREAVANSARHGGARRVRVELQQASNGRRLVVCDDGKGFDVLQATKQRTGFGLTSMRERAEGMPGTFELDSIPGGTTITVTW